MRMCFRFALRALLLAGRAPWLAFLRPRWGFAMVGGLLGGLWGGLTGGVVDRPQRSGPASGPEATGTERCTMPAPALPSDMEGGTSRPREA